MIGKRKAQARLFDVGNVYPLALKAGSFHSQLAEAAPRVFADDDFAAIYSDRLGRPSVPPSLLALALLLQNEAGVSDEEAIERTAFDLRWAAVLGRAAGEPLCAKSTLQLFRAHLILHEGIRTVFRASILEAKRAGLLRGKALRIAVDTKPMEGRGAVQDTYNLLAAGIRQLAAALAKIAGQKLSPWLQSHGLARYAEASLKGSVDIDWSDASARDRLLGEVVADAERLLNHTVGAGAQAAKAAELLQALLLQDVTRNVPSEGSNAAEVRVKEGTAKGRIPSATDPEQRHGHKSHSTLFTGHKASIDDRAARLYAADVDSQIIVAVEALPGDSGDAANVLDMVSQAEENTGEEVAQTIADCAYGAGAIRQAFADSGRELIAKVPREMNRATGLLPKSAFQIDLENNTVTCPGGHTTGVYQQKKDGSRLFYFGAACGGCPLRSQCTTRAKGRTVQVHPQEALLRIARTYQQTPEGRTRLRQRVVVEHRLARLAQLGIRQARYIGRAKTGFQLMIAATIANLRRTWNWQASRAENRGPDPLVVGHPGQNPILIWLQCVLTSATTMSNRQVNVVV